MNTRGDQFLAIIQRAEMPSDAVAALSNSGIVEERSFDESYLGFLDRQIAAKARGPEWDDLYSARRKNLAEYAGVPLINVSARNADIIYLAKIDSESETIIHWERLSEDGFSYLGK